MDSPNTISKPLLLVVKNILRQLTTACRKFMFGCIETAL